jgi:lauroyl/myristoyl acyltransferase
MAQALGQLRRAVAQSALQQLIAATAGLSVDSQRALVRASIAALAAIPTLRWKVRRNMRLALGDDVPRQAVGLYFRRLAWFQASSLAILHHGLSATPVIDEIVLDASVRALDDAVAEGRGVVLVTPHWSGHGIVCAVIARRHPMTLLVRAAARPERAALKQKWYEALGTEIVLRPTGTATQIKDAVAYLKVLKKGRTLGIAPDLLTDSGPSFETRIFGRPARMPGGAFALALSTRAPLIRVSVRWETDARMLVMFERVSLPADGADQDEAIRLAVGDWCRWIEEKLRAHPENWLFWLDKRWSRFLQATARVPGA